MTKKKYLSRTQQERCYIAAQKILRHFELDTKLLDTFSKKQKEKMFAVRFEPPIVKPDKDNTVPRQYIKKIHASVYRYMKTHFWGNPENNLTYMELAVYGLSFLINMSFMNERKVYVPGSPQEAAAEKIGEKYSDFDIYQTAFKEPLFYIWYLTQCYSKVNFRFYGFKYDWDNIPGSMGMKVIIRITAQNSETKKFTVNNVERKAFRLLIPDNGIYAPMEATVARKTIFPNTREDGNLNIYIQSHVLHRLKERLDSFEPFVLNILIQFAFTEGMHVVINGNQILFTCMLEYKQPIGYFAFFVQGNDLVINTFIPLVSGITPEGQKLHEILPLSKDELIFLGMDKTSFFATVDFEQIPKLKQALIDSNIWKTKLLIERTYFRETNGENDSPIDEKKTLFVKNFLEKFENQQDEKKFFPDEKIHP